MSVQLTAAQLDQKLKDLVHWERFALHLEGIFPADVDIIKRDHPQQVINQRTALFDKWLRVCPKPTWDKVILALETVDENRIAQEIAKQLPTHPLGNEHLLKSTSTEVMVNKDIVEELSSLYNSFAKISFKCVKEFTMQVDTGQLELGDIVMRTKQESAYIFDALDGVTNIDSFFNVVSPHYHFLNCHLLVALVEEFLPSSELLDKLTSHVRNVNTFKKTVKVRDLKRQLSRFINKSPHEAPVTVRANDAWEENELRVVEILLQSLFRLTHTDLLKIFRVVPGSLLIVVLAPHHITMSLITHSKHMIQFMRLTGIISLQVGETYVLQDKENGNYTFENGLMASVKTSNYEAVRFLLEQTHVNVNVQICTTSKIMTALMLACFRNDIAMVELLLEENADPNLKPQGGIAPLFIGCQSGHLEVVKRLLQANVNPDTPRDDGATPLHIACGKGHLQIVEQLLQAKTNLGSLLNNGGTPLHIASQYGHLQIVEKLLQANVNPSTPRSDEATPLFVSSWFGHLEIVEKFLEVGVNPDTPANDGVTPLYIASQSGHLKVVEKLLQANANPDAPANDGVTPLYIASRKGHLEVVQRLLQANANPDIPANNGSTPLFIACENNHLEIFERLVKAKANADTPTNDGVTPLYIASQNGHLKMVEKLLQQAGVNPDIAANDGVTPLYIASQNGHLNIVEKLLQANVDPDIPRDNGSTPLFIASQFGHLEIVEMLLEAKVNPNTQANSGSTPLHVAAENDHLEVVKRLLKAKSNSDTPTNIGVTPLLIACQFGHIQIIRKFLQIANVNPGASTNDGVTPLYIACQNGHLEVVKRLLKAKVNPNACRKDGNTPLSVARRFDIVCLLLDHGVKIHSVSGLVSRFDINTLYGHAKIAELLKRLNY